MNEEDLISPARRSVPLDVRADGDDEDSRQLSGYAVTRGRNSYWEVFVPGAFQKSLDAKSDDKPFVMGWMHREPIGRWTEFEEDEEKGLHVAGAASDTTLGRDAITLVKDRAVTGLSIGFFPIDEIYVANGDEITLDTPFGKVTLQNDEPTFYVTEADVVEASLVMSPSDDDARLVRGAELVSAFPGLRPDATAEDRERSREHLAQGRLAGELPLLRRRSIERALREPESPAPTEPSALERACADFQATIDGLKEPPPE